MNYLDKELRGKELREFIMDRDTGISDLIRQYGVTLKQGHGVLTCYYVNNNLDDPNPFGATLDSGEKIAIDRFDILSFDNKTNVKDSIDSLIIYRAIILEK